MTMRLNAAMRIPASNGGNRNVKTTMPSASVRHRTLRSAWWWASSAAGSVWSRSHVAKARPSSAAGTSIAMANSSSSLSAVAMRVKVRTFEYETSTVANASAIAGNSASRRPMRIHSLAVQGSTSAAAASQCAAVGAWVAHSVESANSAANTTSRC